MRSEAGKKPTIGFICTWPVYQGTTIDRYAHSLIQGISAAADEYGCNLLLGCGFSATGNNPQRHSFWPVPGAGIDFVPVGPWNTDGLIIVPDELSETQSRYVRDLLAGGFPVIFTTPEGPGPVVTVNNTLGIRLAFTHLLEHGHRQIAFIAGHSGRDGDSEERLRAYREALCAAGLPENPRLVEFGEHRKDGGTQAMRKILATGEPFSAVIASNDLSCLGIIEVLKESGFRIPQDVAVIGFDDILDARSLSPSLTTIRHPTFTLGYQAVVMLMEYVHGEQRGFKRVVVPPRLIIRQSCGCRPAESSLLIPSMIPKTKSVICLADLAREMAEASLIEARNSLLEDLESQSASFLNAFAKSLEHEDAEPVITEVGRLLTWTDERGEDAHVWQAGTAVLYQKMNALISLASGRNQAFAASLLDHVRLEISDQIQRQTTRSMLEHMDMMAQLGLMTAELLAAMDITEAAEILTRHLPSVGIKNALVALYEPDGEDKVSRGVVLFGAGLSASHNGQHFESRKIPISDIYPTTEALHLTILPLDVDNETSGFVAFNAPNPELCAAIVHNLIAALRISRLYRDALEGQRMAEEANKLKNRFLSMVSHELRTPLSLIVGLSDMVLRDQNEKVTLSQHVTQDIEQINLSAQHLGRLIGDVLDLASSEAGRLRILHEPLDLMEVLCVAVKIGEQMAHERGLTWNAQLPRQGPSVIGDRTRLRQVTLNLISNAVKFTSEGQVVLHVTVEDKQVVVSVSDTGIGISPDEQEAIFHEFYRSERTIPSGYGGLGLGLTISKQLVEQHGGKIGVRSPGDLGSGSTFFFTLPIESKASTQANLNPTLALAGSTVLVLTERSDPADLLCTFLCEHGFDIRICCVDEQTDWLLTVIAAPPAALIMGNHLATREGWAIMGMLKRQPATEHIPVLAYSLDTENDRGEFLELNYSQKPLRPEQLAEELVRYCQPETGQHTVLVVEDDPNILDLHSRMVKQIGCKAIVAHNGREALKAIERDKPDLILLDLMMPEMDGFAVLDTLRKNETMRNIPVIVLTARLLSEADLERCNRGVSAILSKGLLNTTETLSLIEAALARKHTLGKATQQLVRQAMACIHTRYAEPLSREDIARHVGITADYLTDCFRQELSITPMTYLRRYRIRQARELLETTDFSIMQVALEVGFSEGAHFTRTFQFEVGMTPRAYRSGKRG